MCLKSGDRIYSVGFTSSRSGLTLRRMKKATIPQSKSYHRFCGTSMALIYKNQGHLQMCIRDRLHMDRGVALARPVVVDQQVVDAQHLVVGEHQPADALHQRPIRPLSLIHISPGRRGAGTGPEVLSVPGPAVTDAPRGAPGPGVSAPPVALRLRE